MHPTAYSHTVVFDSAVSHPLAGPCVQFSYCDHYIRREAAQHRRRGYARAKAWSYSDSVYGSSHSTILSHDQIM